MVYRNRCEMGAQWCMKTTAGRVADGVQKPPLDGRNGVRWVGGRWCTKTAVRWVADGVQKLPWDGWPMVYENNH